MKAKDEGIQVSFQVLKLKTRDMGSQIAFVLVLHEITIQKDANCNLDLVGKRRNLQ